MDYYCSATKPTTKCAIHVCDSVAAGNTGQLAIGKHRAVVRRDDRNTDTPNDFPDKNECFFSASARKHRAFVCAEW